eukprot:849872-Pyramimonas_sp.AAC.1
MSCPRGAAGVAVARAHWLSNWTPLTLAPLSTPVNTPWAAVHWWWIMPEVGLRQDIVPLRVGVCQPIDARRESCA